MLSAFPGSNMRIVSVKLRNALLLLLLAWAGLELALQLAHFAFFAESEAAEPAADSGRFRVLCIGESTTVGYPRGRGSLDSYPSILQRRLEEEFPDLEFQVVNRGLNAVTSSQIRAKLPAWLERYQPHVVLAMLGANDVFYETAADESSFPLRLRLALQNLRTYRLAGLLWEQLRRLRAEPAPPAPRLEPDVYRRILALYQQATALYERDDLAAARRSTSSGCAG
jgi:lysophospholipase L1-like esterase